MRCKIFLPSQACVVLKHLVHAWARQSINVPSINPCINYLMQISCQAAVSLVAARPGTTRHSKIGLLGQASCSVWSLARLIKVQGNIGQAGFLLHRVATKQACMKIQPQPQARQKMLRTHAKLTLYLPGSHIHMSRSRYTYRPIQHSPPLFSLYVTPP